VYNSVFNVLVNSLLLDGTLIGFQPWQTEQ